MEVSSFEFGSLARSMGEVCRRQGLAVPGFRSPPRLAAVDRSLRRRALGTAIVAVRLAGRPAPAVIADMVEGVVAANQLRGPAADRCRAALWEAVAGQLGEMGRRASHVPSTVGAPARVA